MDSTSLLVYQDPESRKDYAWYDLAITTLRRDLRPIVDPNQDSYNKTLLDGKQSMKEVEKSFDDKDFKRDVKIKPLGIMNVFVNEMIETIKKTPPKAEVRAVDPSAIAAKKEDIDKLKYRKILERDRSELQGRIGLGNYKIPKEKFAGNVDEFDKLGLDEKDPDDVNFFEGTYHRLDFEIAAQSLVNGAMKLCKFDKIHVGKYVRDAMASNVNCGQTYVNRVTGQISNDYIYPSEYYFIPSDTEDGHDDIAKGWFRSVTVSEFLGRVGNEFNWDKDWPYLLWAINYCNNTKYTGFTRSGYTYNCCGDPMLMDRCGVGNDWQSNCCEWVMAFRYKVFMGYTEWLCPEVTASYLKNKNTSEYTEIPVGYKLKNKKERTEYEKESWYGWSLLSSYYLATTSTSQYIFSYGKVYHHLKEGANDEYARYTCWSFRNQGKSAAEIAEPFINMANFTFYRMLWAIYKAKPEEDQFLINELLEIAKGVQRQFSQNALTAAGTPQLDNILDQIIQYQRQKSIRIRAYPRIDGREIGQLPPLKNEKSGLDPIAVSMQAIIMWAQQMIATQIGINPMRVGGNPPSRESFKSEQQTLESSYASTSYIYRMIQYMKEHMATVTMLYGQDICKFKDSVPYNWVQNLIGEEQMTSLKILDDVAAHRYSIFVEDINDVYDKQEIKQAAGIALAEKQITFDQWFVITQTQDFKRAAQLLAFLQRKNEKKLRNQALQDQKIQQQQAQQLHEMKMAEMTFDRETKFGVADRDAAALVKSAQIQAQGRVEVKQLQNDAEPVKQQAKADADKQVIEEKKNAEEQAAFAT